MGARLIHSKLKYRYDGVMDMARFKVGQIVRLKICANDLGIIITECKEPDGYWSVALRTRLHGRIQRMRIKEGNLEPYKNHCWNCNKNDLDSDVHETCDRCGWVKCPACGKCEKKICGLSAVMICEEPYYAKLEDLEEIIRRS